MSTQIASPGGVLTMTGRNDACVCGSGKKHKKCCFLKEIPRIQKSNLPIIKNPEQIKGIRAASQLVARILFDLHDIIKPGMSTLDIDAFVADRVAQAGAISASKGYIMEPAPPFPGNLCTSVNSVVCHGIPSATEILQEGDIVNCDIAVILNGYFGDASKTYGVGGTMRLSDDARNLITRTAEAMFAGIKAIVPGKPVSRIGYAIEELVKPFGYGIVKELTGHGVGLAFHEDSGPTVFHFKNNEKTLLLPGMTFTVEPMINLGSREIYVAPDEWTVKTRDGKISAQFEHTVLVTDDGYEILSQP